MIFGFVWKAVKNVILLIKSVFEPFVKHSKIKIASNLMYEIMRKDKMSTNSMMCRIIGLMSCAFMWTQLNWTLRLLRCCMCAVLFNNESLLGFALLSPIPVLLELVLNWNQELKTIFCFGVYFEIEWKILFIILSPFRIKSFKS